MLYDTTLAGNSTVPGSPTIPACAGKYPDNVWDGSACFCVLYDSAVQEQLVGRLCARARMDVVCSPLFCLLFAYLGLLQYCCCVPAFPPSVHPKTIMRCQAGRQEIRPCLLVTCHFLLRTAGMHLSSTTHARQHGHQKAPLVSHVGTGCPVGCLFCLGVYGVRCSREQTNQPDTMCAVGWSFKNVLIIMAVFLPLFSGCAPPVLILLMSDGSTMFCETGAKT